MLSRELNTTISLFSLIYIISFKFSAYKILVKDELLEIKPFYAFTSHIFNKATKCEILVLRSPSSSSHEKAKFRCCAKAIAILSGKYLRRKCKEKEYHTLILELKVNGKG